MTTPEQLKVYDFILQYMQQKNHAPTVSEIAAGVSRSRGLISRYLHALAKAGYLLLLPGEHRNIRLVAPAEPCIPLLGYIAAGQPIEAIEDANPFDVLSLLKGTNYAALAVKGNSMVEVGIFDGDYIFYEPRNTAENGAIVVALIDQQEATLKRFQRNKDKTVTLVPANIALKPQVYEAHRVTIQGVYRGVMRINR